MIKTKYLGVNGLSNGEKDISNVINAWIKQNAGIKVIDIKFQTHYAQTDCRTMTQIADALILYEEKHDDRRNDVTKAMYDSEFAQLKENIKPALEHIDMCKINNTEIHYEIIWYEPSAERGPQFDLLLKKYETVCAIMQSYWDKKEIVGALVAGSDPSDKQILDMARDMLDIYLPDYHYRFDERIF